MENYEILQPLINNKAWLKLLGIISIIYGALTALSIVGLIVCWIPIWLGILLVKSASEFEKYEYSDEEEAATVALENLALFFKIVAIITIVGISLSVVSILIAIAVAG